MAKTKTKIYLDRNEMLGAFFLVRAWGNHAKVARALGVSNGAIGDLMRDIGISLTTGKVVQRRKHGEDLKVTVKMLSSHPATQREQAQEQLPLEPKLRGVARLKKLQQETVEAINEAIEDETVELRTQLDNITQAVSQVTNLQK